MSYGFIQDMPWLDMLLSINLYLGLLVEVSLSAPEDSRCSSDTRSSSSDALHGQMWSRVNKLSATSINRYRSHSSEILTIPEKTHITRPSLLRSWYQMLRWIINLLPPARYPVHSWSRTRLTYAGCVGGTHRSASSTFHDYIPRCLLPDVIT